MKLIYPKLMVADAIVFGTPAYFELLSGLLKDFLDRTCPIWPKLAGKKAAGMAVAEEGGGKAIENLKTYVVLCGMEWIGGVSALAKLPGEIAGDKNTERKLIRLAHRLIRSLQT
jgi:multimeric flavodoxin WrbA